MSMYFYDETDDWPEYEFIKKEIYRLEKAHLEICKELQKVGSALKSNPENVDLKNKATRLKKALNGIEKRLNESQSLYR